MHKGNRRTLLRVICSTAPQHLWRCIPSEFIPLHGHCPTCGSSFTLPGPGPAGRPGVHACATVLHQRALHRRTAGIFETLGSTQRRHGLRSLYRGYGVSAAAIGAYKALYFGLYDTACAWMARVGGGRDSPMRRALAWPGRVKERMRMVHPARAWQGRVKGVSHVPRARAAWAGRLRDDGLGGDGDWACLRRSSVGSRRAAWWVCALLARVGTRARTRPTGPAPPPLLQGGGGPASLFDRFMAANVVVVAASTITYPLDVVRKRLVADTALPHRQVRCVWMRAGGDRKSVV